jgi:hypothetical protein
MSGLRRARTLSITEPKLSSNTIYVLNGRADPSMKVWHASAIHDFVECVVDGHKFAERQMKSGRSWLNGG